ncbi:ribulose phosphate epimerase [Photobacterium leiognathi subsp. mandapamensis]|nr:ribulose phosphate epimerase [Photobacterium leiognathi subsp. mandapamensis]
MKKQEQEKQTLFSVIYSVLAALFGVQSDKNCYQDFKQPTAWPFIITGIIIIVLMVGAIIAVAQWATANI